MDPRVNTQRILTERCRITSPPCERYKKPQGSSKKLPSCQRMTRLETKTRRPERLLQSWSKNMLPSEILLCFQSKPFCVMTHGVMTIRRRNGSPAVKSILILTMVSHPSSRTVNTPGNPSKCWATTKRKENSKSKSVKLLRQRWWPDYPSSFTRKILINLDKESLSARSVKSKLRKN